MAELKPCPFCGREAELYVTKHLPHGYDYTPRCTETSCAGRLTKKFGFRSLAVAAWNRRDGETNA